MKHCPDSPFGLTIRLDSKERFVQFEFSKIVCARAIGGGTGFSAFCAGKSLEEILDLDFRMVVAALNLNADEEGQFILYVELDAFKSAIVRFLGVERPDVDSQRCRVTCVEQKDGFTDITLVILPPWPAKSFPSLGP